VNIQVQIANPKCLFKKINNFNRKWENLLFILGNRGRKEWVHLVVKLLHFLVSQTPKKLMMFNNSFGRIWFFIFARVISPCPLAKTIGFKVSFMPMPLCLISVFSYGRILTCYGQEDNDLTYFVQFCICNSSLASFDIWMPWVFVDTFIFGY
jgi:hypothetical protein